MIDTTLDRAIKNDAERLVSRISQRWSAQTMKPVHADMQYGQYAEAVLNIIAISHKEKLKLTAYERKKISGLTKMMQIQSEVAELFEYLKGFSGDRGIDQDENVMALLR